MHDEAFNLSVRQFLKHFGVTAQREIERSVVAAIEGGKLRGDEVLHAKTVLTVDGVLETTVEGKISLS